MPAGTRARVRAETTRAILDEARRQLAEHGAAALSLRSVAREIGMVSSAVYRYVASRDELLTRLIVEAYDAVGERAEAARDPDAPPRAQWRAVWRAVRAWALEHPAEYALVYGSPVPGYAAPAETIPAAGRVATVLVAIVAEHGSCPPGDGPGDLLEGLLVRDVLPGIPPALAVPAVAAWTQLFGTVGFEVFGQYHNVVRDREGFLDRVADTAATTLGLPGGAWDRPGGLTPGAHHVDGGVAGIADVVVARESHMAEHDRGAEPSLPETERRERAAEGAADESSGSSLAASERRSREAQHDDATSLPGTEQRERAAEEAADADRADGSLPSLPATERRGRGATGG
ncbi:MAG TPA: TetR/AcrR family transcriptional regulator [Actinomycetospora sp.]|nr:TetR/AcrR family transcriptional regulator [Actinomycetospora sp.]